jgi:hypothetical protein
MRNCGVFAAEPLLGRKVRRREKLKKTTTYRTERDILHLDTLKTSGIIFLICIGLLQFLAR